MTTETIIKKKVFNRLKTRIENKSEVEKFNDWMANKVKSVFYSDHEKMCNAYNRIL